MSLRDQKAGSGTHGAANGSTAGGTYGATAESSLLGFIHARTAGEPEAQDQDCGKRTRFHDY